jgi:hypothetical protein
MGLQGYLDNLLLSRADGTAPQSPGDNVLLDGLRYLVSSLEEDDAFSDRGRQFVAADVSRWISRYTSYEKDFAAYPEILSVPVEQPIFIVGFGRTGSTLLHNLLALDERARAPRLWELLSTSPPPRSESYDTDPRIARAQQYLQAMTVLAPNVLGIHPMHSTRPDECHWMMQHGPHQFLRYRAAAYWSWLSQLENGDLLALYMYYKRQIQHLQFFHRGAYWVSKSLVHLFYMPVVSAVFPDARIIRLHRDPCECIPSLASLAAAYRGIYLKSVDHQDLGDFMLQLFVALSTRLMHAEGALEPARVVDIQYEDFVADPIGAVRRIYAQFGIALTPQCEDAQRRYLISDKPTHKHAYSLEQFGLSRNGVMSQCEPYLSWSRARRN